MICPKCGHERSDNDDPLIPDYQCPACGIIYRKYQRYAGEILSEQASTTIEDTQPQAPPEIFEADESQHTRKNNDFLQTAITPSQAVFAIIIIIVVIGWMALNNSTRNTPSADQASQAPRQRTESEVRQIAKNKEIERQQNIAKQKVEHQKREAACQLDMNCSAKKAFVGEASVNCERNVERMAKYRFKWTDSWLQSKFNNIIWKDSARTVLHASGGYLELENGFGAWQPYRYVCEVRAADKQVLDIQMAPGRM